MSSDIASTAVRAIIESYADGMNAGEELQLGKIEAILAAYDRALEDPKVVIPTYLHAALEGARKEGLRATVKEQRGVGRTEYTIGGTLDEVLSEIRRKFTDFPIMAYGSHLHLMTVENDGVYIARMSRANSCG
jgi:hypothetical protein